jgi:hypothetical protein
MAQDDDRREDDGEDRDGPEGGRMRFQDGSTAPREPSLAERRARELALRREAEERLRAEEDAEQARKKRKRVLVGTGVTVGVVALIAVGYSAAQPQATTTAQCVDEETNEIVDESNCVTPAPTGGYYGGGFYPIFIGGGGRQYHYNYGGSGTVGGPVVGGTTAVPREGTRVTTPSGRDVSPRASSPGISRGGLGVSGGGSSSGS